MTFGPPKSNLSNKALLSHLGLTAQDLSSHIFLCGQTGSGKTTVLRKLLCAYVQMLAPGAVHLCVKADEADWICELISRSRLRNRLMRLIPGQFTFSIAAYECGREGGSPASLTRYLIRLNEQLKRQKGPGGGDSFWKNLFFDFMHYAAIIAWLARGKLMTLEHVSQIITTCPYSAENASSEEFKNSACWQLLNEAESNITNGVDKRAFSRAVDFFLNIQIGLGSKARSAGVQECSSILSHFLLSPFFETFCTPNSDFTPDVPLHRVYVVIDFSVLLHQESALMCQSLIAMMVIDAALRQKDPAYHVLIVRDELQLLVADPLYECMAHSVARSHKLSFWSAVQNLPILLASFGGDQRAEVQMKALLGNYVTKFVLANSCMDVTNRYFSTMFGQHREQMVQLNQRQSQEPQGMMDAVLGSSPWSFGLSETFHDRIPPDRFLYLRRGGPPDFAIDAYMTQGGRIFSETQLPFKLVTFYQD